MLGAEQPRLHLEARMRHLTEKWEKSEKTGDGKIQRRAERQGKEKGTALQRRADKRVPPPPPFQDSEVCKPGLGWRGSGKLTFPSSPFCLESRPRGAG